MSSGNRIWAMFFSLAAVALLSRPAQARTFDFKSERFATYFGGTFGPSNVGDTAYGASSGNDVSVNKRVATNASGELGVLISTPKLNLKLGAELILPRNYSDIEGSDASGNKLFTLSSKIQALVPMATVEVLAFQTSTSRMIVGAGGGMAFVTLDNTYQMTPTGTATLGVGDFTESASGSTAAFQMYTGYEVLFTDTVTACFNLGYRHISVPTFKSTKATTAISGTQTESGDIINMNGTNRTVDLGGVFAGLSFRFYIGL